MQDLKKSPKIAISAPSDNFVGLYLRNWGTYRQSEKNLLSSNISSTCPHNMVNLRSTSGWDRFVSLGYPCKFQRVSRLCSVTARHSSSGRQPNFAALNRRRHLYSAGRPSRWALAHILVSDIFITYGDICSGSPPARALKWGSPLLLGDIRAEWLKILLRYSR